MSPCELDVICSHSFLPYQRPSLCSSSQLNCSLCCWGSDQLRLNLHTEAFFGRSNILRFFWTGGFSLRSLSGLINSAAEFESASSSDAEKSSTTLADSLLTEVAIFLTIRLPISTCRDYPISIHFPKPISRKTRINLCSWRHCWCLDRSSSWLTVETMEMSRNHAPTYLLVSRVLYRLFGWVGRAASRLKRIEQVVGVKILWKLDMSLLLENFVRKWEKRDRTVVFGWDTVSTFVKRLSNGTLPRDREHRTSNGGVDNGIQWIRDDYMASDKDSRRWMVLSGAWQSSTSVNVVKNIQDGPRNRREVILKSGFAKVFDWTTSEKWRWRGCRGRCTWSEDKWVGDQKESGGEPMSW